MVTMFCLLTPLNTAPITTFFHDFSGYEFSSLDRELLGYGVNFALAPPSAFNIDPYSGWKADWFTFKRGLHRQDFFIQTSGQQSEAADHVSSEYSAPKKALRVPSEWDPTVDEEDYVPTEELTVFFEEM